MSEEKVLCSHVLTIRFDQLEDNRVNWYIEPDALVATTERFGLIDLAECGAPLAAMGIRALWKLCVDGLVYHALEQANGVQAAVNRRLLADYTLPEMDWEVTERTLN